MPEPQTTLYANVINVRVTPQEFVLDFGSFFPDGPQQGVPADFKPAVRVVMPQAALPGLHGLLGQHLAHLAGGSPVKAPVGFQGQPDKKGQPQ